MKLKINDVNKTSQIVVRITESQKRRLQKIAGQNKTTISKAIRAMLEVILK